MIVAAFKFELRSFTCLLCQHTANTEITSRIALQTVTVHVIESGILYIEMEVNTYS